MTSVNFFSETDYLKYPNLTRLLKNEMVRVDHEEHIKLPNNLFFKQDTTAFLYLKRLALKIFHTIRWFFLSEYRERFEKTSLRISSQILKIENFDPLPEEIGSFFLRKKSSAHCPIVQVNPLVKIAVDDQVSKSATNDFNLAPLVSDVYPKNQGIEVDVESAVSKSVVPAQPSVFCPVALAVDDLGSENGPEDSVSAPAVFGNPALEEGEEFEIKDVPENSVSAQPVFENPSLEEEEEFELKDASEDLDSVQTISEPIFPLEIQNFLKKIETETNTQLKLIFEKFFSHFTEESKESTFKENGKDSWLLTLSQPLNLWVESEYRGGIILIFEKDVQIKFEKNSKKASIKFIKGFKCYLHPEELVKEIPRGFKSLLKKAAAAGIFTPTVHGLENSGEDDLIFEGGAKLGGLFSSKKPKERKVSSLCETWARGEPVKSDNLKEFIQNKYNEVQTKNNK